ncbi:hypothetical protein SprV_0100051900 [Sparganum proliferum]
MAKRSGDRRSHLGSKSDHRHRSQNRGLQVKSVSIPGCRPSAASNMPTVLTNVPGTNRSRRTFSDSGGQQPDKIYFSHSHPCRKPRDDRHLRHRRLHRRRPAAAAIRPASPPTSTAAASITTTTSSRAPPPLTDGTKSNGPPTSNITNIPTSTDVDSVHTCPHCDRTFTSYIGLADHLRIHRTGTGAWSTNNHTRHNRPTAPAHSLTA